GNSIVGGRARFYQNEKARRKSRPPGLWRESVRISERELQLIANHASTTFRKLRMEELTVCRSENVRRHACAQWCERTHTGSAVLRMVENVVELRPHFDELRFINPDPLQQIHVPVVLTRSAQRIATERTTPSGAREQSDVLRVRGIDTSTAGIRIRVEGRASCRAAYVHRGCCNCRYRTNSRLTRWIEVRSVEVSSDRVGILSIDNGERHSGFKGRHAGDLKSSQNLPCKSMLLSEERQLVDVSQREPVCAIEKRDGTFQPLATEDSRERRLLWQISIRHAEDFAAVVNQLG